MLLTQQDRDKFRALAVAGHTMWWGYLHVNGRCQLHRWYGDHADYTSDVQDNPFVVRSVWPFEATTKEGALLILAAKLGLPQVNLNGQTIEMCQGINLSTK